MDPITAALAALKPPAKYSFWVLLSLAIADSGILHLSSLAGSLPAEWIVGLQILEWFLWVAVSIFAIVLFVKLLKTKQESHKLGVTFPSPHTHIWHEPKQRDGSINTQIIADVLVKNLTDNPLGLSSVRLIKPRIEGPLLHGWALIKERNSPYSSTTMGTGTKISPNDSNPVNLHVIIGASLGLTELGKESIEVILGLIDEDGYETKVKTKFNIQ